MNTFEYLSEEMIMLFSVKISPFYFKQVFCLRLTLKIDGSVILVYYINMLCFNSSINRKIFDFFVDFIQRNINCIKIKEERQCITHCLSLSVLTNYRRTRYLKRLRLRFKVIYIILNIAQFVKEILKIFQHNY